MDHRNYNVLFKYINAYIISYLFSNLSKKILMFSIAIYLARTVDYFSIITFLIFYLAYMTVYFLNDYIDRQLDIGRKYIHPYKLVFNRGYLFTLGVIHFLGFIGILYILNYEIAVIASIIIFFGIIRSYIRNKTLREISLGVLQFLQFCLFFYILGKPEGIIEHITLLLQFSLVYMFLYYIHKIPDDGECKKKSLVYVILISILSILALAEIKDLVPLIYLVVSLTFVFLAYGIFTKQMIKKSYMNVMKICSVVYYFLSLALIASVHYGYFPEIPEYITNSGVLEFLTNINGELKENILDFLQSF